MNLRRRRRRRRLLAALILLLLAALLLTVFRYLPLVRTLAAVRIENETSNRIVEAIDRQIESGAIRYERMIRLKTDEQGRVRALIADVAEMNRLKTLILREIGETVGEMREQSLDVPLGSVLAPALFSGCGASIPVRIVSFQTSGAEFCSSFTQAGVNQTLHQIRLDVRVDVTALTPAGRMNVPVSVETIVAQTVIVGEVPQTVISVTGE